MKQLFFAQTLFSVQRAAAFCILIYKAEKILKKDSLI